MSLNWIDLKSEKDINDVIEESFNNSLGVAVFKHSTRCSISSVAKNRLSSTWDFENELPIYYLDLIAYRSISSLISEKFNVYHESPQLLIIKDGICIYDASHLSISVKDIRENIDARN